ncbi:OmpA family protein [Kineococcus gypseus]|uniref:OmpA family protein n=1 Tax=Kineococcus gypseus TaxID=1637102 RepID=UPI003D7DDB6A
MPTAGAITGGLPTAGVIDGLLPRPETTPTPPPCSGFTVTGAAFATGEDELTAQGQASVAGLVGEIAGKLKAPGASLLIVGFTDPRPPRDGRTNEDLSRSRAQAVADVLTRSLDGGQPVLVEGRGARERLSTGTTEDDYARDRRVEVIVNCPVSQ